MSFDAKRIDQMPVIKNIEDFDQTSGNRLERMIFNNRLMIVIVCGIVTLLMAYQASKIVFNASFEKMIPHNQPYIKNYLENKSELRGLGNSIRVVVENTDGDIFDPEYLESLKQITDELFLTPGVDRAWTKGIWMPAVRWDEVTEEGFRGGPVMPDSYNGSRESIEELRRNIGRSGIVGDLVASDFKSSVIFCPLLDTDPSTGKPLDYDRFSKGLEKIRQKHTLNNHEQTAGSKQSGKINIHIVGFAKLVGELMEGLLVVMTFFAVAAVIAAIFIFLYTRCLRSTVMLIACSQVAVLWQLGLISSFGFELDPYSILVPFLVFAIGVSHGAQKMNGIMQDVGRGTHRLVAARYTFRRLFLPGVTALSADAVGFAVMMLIDIPVIKDLALTASIGVAVLIFTNLILLPVLLSYIGVSPSAAKRSLMEENEEIKGKGMGKVWRWLDRFTEKRWATGAITVAVVMAVLGFIVSLDLKIGDLDRGAPELRANSRYNQDSAYVDAHYSLSSDQFALILKTQIDGAQNYETLIEADRLAWALQQLPGVQTTVSLVDSVRQITAGTYEGNPKWYSLSRNQQVLNYAGHQAMVNNPDLFNVDGSVMPVIAYLSDHKAETLTRVVKVADDFSRKHSVKDRQFLLCAGSAGIAAATNIVVKEASRTMMLYVYAAVILLCFITFRSWRAVVVAVLPLVMTSILCEALMVVLGIGVKVATLPVIALGVGIGVDYALYLLSVQLANQKMGLSLGESYRHAVQFTGKVVGLVGITLAAGVVTWMFSPIKFQGDMGILLTFMFLYNMIGALILIPSLSYYLLNKKECVNAADDLDMAADVSSAGR